MNSHSSLTHECSRVLDTRLLTRPWHTDSDSSLTHEPISTFPCSASTLVTQLRHRTVSPPRNFDAPDVVPCSHQGRSGAASRSDPRRNGRIGPLSVRAFPAPLSTQSPAFWWSNIETLISQKAFIRSFGKNQFPYKSINQFFILVMMKD